MKLTLFFISLLIIGCGDDKGYFEPEFKPYVTGFIDAARRNNKEINVDLISISFMDVPEHSTTGLVFGKCEDGVIYIVKPYWEATSESRREVILYHELGHCVLGRDHLGGWNAQLDIPLSIMTSMSSIVIDYWDNNREYYLSELFK